MDSDEQIPSELPPDSLHLEIHAALRALIHPHSRPDFSGLQALLPHVFPKDSSLSAQCIRSSLEQGLERMRTDHPDSYSLLRERFWEGRSMQELSLHQGRSSSGLYAMQSQALERLAQTMRSLEKAAASNRSEAISFRCRNLPPAPFQRLFGFEDALAQIERWLRDPQGPPIISIEGLGGLGKTALAYAAVRAALCSGAWADVAWVSAMDRPFFLWDAPDTPPPLDPDRMIEQIASQLGVPESPADLNSEERRLAIRNILSEKPYLIVREDLEPEHRPKDFLPNLLPPTGSTRFLLTSRQRLPLFSGCANLYLHELPHEVCIAILQHEAGERKLQISAEDMEKVFSLVGGNPMALKLVIGQSASLPLHRVLENLVPAAKGTPAGIILQQIYRHSWKLLLPGARQVLFAMERFSPNGTTYEDLQRATDLGSKELDSALQQLVTHSLAVYDPAPIDKYRIHRLTYIFLWTMQRGGVMNLIDTKPVGSGAGLQ
jgi:hypothetical protein